MIKKTKTCFNKRENGGIWWKYGKTVKKCLEKYQKEKNLFSPNKKLSFWPKVRLKMKCRSSCRQLIAEVAMLDQRQIFSLLFLFFIIIVISCLTLKKTNCNLSCLCWEEKHFRSLMSLFKRQRRRRIRRDLCSAQRARAFWAQMLNVLLVFFSRSTEWILLT